MSYKDVQSRLSFFLYGEDAERVTVKREDGIWKVRYDAHGKDVLHAKRDIANLISSMTGGALISIVHGYNKGTAIKNMLRKCDFGKRVLSVASPSFNPGVTNITVGATV